MIDTLTFYDRYFGGILLAITWKINYVNMQHNYVHMQFIYVSMQDLYVNMQHLYVNMQHNSSCMSKY